MYRVVCSVARPSLANGTAAAVRALATSSAASETPWRKTSTGLVGLPVDPNARQNLAAKQREILDKIKIIPEHTAYRKAMEAVAKYRLRVRNLCLHLYLGSYCCCHESLVLSASIMLYMLCIS
jgi:ETC complex I subunit conserved region